MRCEECGGRRQWDYVGYRDNAPQHLTHCICCGKAFFSLAPVSPVIGTQEVVKPRWTDNTQLSWADLR
jgi:NAD-dependent SIR2 family protein deacetylase